MFYEDYESITNKLITSLKREFDNAGFTKAVLGLSGGIDSAVVAFLVERALGGKNVIGVMLPYKTNSESSILDAKSVAKTTNINLKKIEINEAVKAFLSREETISNLRLGNIAARCRMIYLFDIASAEKALVVGTSNLTELYLGYGTLFGDMASIINPLGNLYKTQVNGLAKYLGVPSSIINKPPSAELVAGQTDESDFGFSYQDADEIIDLIFEQKLSFEECLMKGYERKTVLQVIKRVENNKFKKYIPKILEII